MKKILMICYEFTPIISPGTNRYSQFVKYFPEFGWEPIILTIKNPSRFLHINQSIKPPKNLKVFHSLEVPTIFLWKIIQKLTKKSLFKFKYIGWLPHTLYTAYKIIKKERIDLIFAGCQPFSVAIIGLFLKSLTKIPLIIDFRDPIQNPNKIEGKIIDYCVQNADMNLIVTESMRDFFKQGNFTLIPNGYIELPETPEIASIRKDKFNLIYTGSIYPDWGPILKNFLLAVKEIVKTDKEFSLTFIGYNHQKILMPIISEINLNLKEVEINFLGHLPYEKCLSFIKHASATLIIRPANLNFALGSKIFDYLLSEAPIFGVLDARNETTKFIKKANLGLVVDTDVNSIVIGLKKILEGYSLERNWNFIKTYHRREITKKLVKLMDVIYEGKK